MRLNSVFRFAQSFVVIAAAAAAHAQGTWQPLAHQPPWAPSTMMLLTDGSILTQRDYPNGNQWAKLVPDINGSYVNGTWTVLHSSNWTRLYYACSVFADGRVIVAGGEYSNAGSETNKTEIYDPVADLWTEILGPGWTEIGDAPGCILEDGRFFLSSIVDQRTAFYDPNTGIWTPGPNKMDSQATEENWARLADGSIIAPMCRNHPFAERWVPSTNTWVAAGRTVVDLVLPGSIESGATIALPDGRAIFIGGTPHIGFYQYPAVPTDPGVWTAGPDFPLINGRMVGAEDAPACVLPNGHVLITVGPVTANGGTYESPTYFFEYDGFNLVRISDPVNSGGVPYSGRMMVTPTGQVLYAHGNTIQVYSPSGSPDPAWKPVITMAPAAVAPNGTYAIQGTQLNGLTEAIGYGDEGQPATNYPIARIRNLITGHISYCRTFNHSTMAIATGNQVVSTNFKVPANIEIGDSEFTVIANGIASTPVPIVVSGVKDLFVTSFSFFRGAPSGGGLFETTLSDDLYLKGSPGPVLNAAEAPLQLIMSATSPFRHPTTFQFKIESAGSIGNLGQTLLLWNYLANGWEQVDFHALPTSDGTIMANPTGDTSRFVNPITFETKANISIKPAGPVTVSFWSFRVDLATWMVGA